jgi:branched-subunit amino acid aminotransferase/4-amino-4-deoxychorismate lyase
MDELTFRRDRSAGVYSTIWIPDGQPIALGAHLARLSHSLQSVYGLGLPAETASLICEAAAAAPDCNVLRVDLIPTDGEVSISIATSQRAVGAEFRFRTVQVDEWSGEHKWRDRPAIEPGTALFVDSQQHVLEADLASVFAVIDGTLVAPPTTNVLPGVGRAVIMLAARELELPVRVAPLPLADFMNADAAFATNAIRRLTPIRRVDDKEWPFESDPLLTQLRSFLEQRERWDIDGDAYWRAIQTHQHQSFGPGHQD